MGKIILGILSIILGVAALLAISIWCGFPSPAGFDRVYVVYVSVLISFALIVIGIFVLATIFIERG